MSRFCKIIENLPWPIPCHTGLNALQKRDKKLIQCKASPNSLSSVDLDAGLTRIFPEEPRWDYGVACNQPMLCVVWIEVHPATSGEVRKVERKLKWLRSFIRKHLSELNLAPQKFYWIASGRIQIPRHTPQYRHLSILKSKGLYGPINRIDVCRELQNLCCG